MLVAAVLGADPVEASVVTGRAPPRLMREPEHAVPIVGVAVVLMVAGIAIFGIITSIAAYFVEQKAEADLSERLDQIMERLEMIEAKLPVDERSTANR